MIEPEFPNIVRILADRFEDKGVSRFLHFRENEIFSFLVIGVIVFFVYAFGRRLTPVPERKQGVLEIVAGAADDFICGILGPQGRRFTPFIGTLFIYIMAMNLCGIVPFLKSSTSSWSTTLALGLCVFVYVQYTALKELGFLGYFDHLMGKPRGVLAFSLVIPVFMLALHILSELIRPISLSLRLRSNIWGEDMLFGVLAGFGIKGIPLLLFSTLLMIMGAIVQTVVFCLLTTVYFALVMRHEE